MTPVIVVSCERAQPDGCCTTPGRVVPVRRRRRLPGPRPHGRRGPVRGVGDPPRACRPGRMVSPAAAGRGHDGPHDRPRAGRGQGAAPGDLGRGARPGGAASAPRRALATINRAAATAPLVPELAADGTTAGWATPVRAPQALSTLAREMIELLSGPLSGRIRECASDDCPLVFVDSSRPGTRRWCAMERCGNRHKLRARRARRAADP
jgi:CGNR zinc finger